MTQRISYLIAVAILLLNAAATRAQAPATKIIADQFDRYRQYGLVEKIFVHTDKNTYVPGEICWFKIYNVDASFHRPLSLDKVAYVEILDHNNLPVLQAKLALEKGSGNGSLYLPPSLSSGNYRLRAYTNWMKNYGADYFFEKTIRLINVQKNQPAFAVAKTPSYEIAFFPEGGNLVAGTRSRIGFKVTDQFGKGVYGEGVVLNDKGDSIARFKTLKFGMGSFSFTPVDGAKYKAVVKLAGGEQQVKELPASYGSGYSMYLERLAQGQIKLTVQAAGKADVAGAPVFLFVQTRNVIKAIMSNTLQNGRAEFILDSAKTGEGISQLTVFNETRHPVGERLVFKKPWRTLQISAVPDQSLYDIRKKINVAVASATPEGRQVAADMSMAVYRVDSLTDIDGQDINNYLLLSADLPGNIENPGYYFSEKDDVSAEAADNLMLTQGWRRFKWDDILSDKKPAFRFLPEVHGHIINGKMTSLIPGRKIQGIDAYLTVPGTRTQFQTAGADAEGRLKFEMPHFYSDGDIIVQTNNEQDSGYRIEIEQPFSMDHSQKKLAPVDAAAQNNALLEMYIAAQVQNTYAYNKLNRSSAPLADTTPFYYKPDVVYLLDNYVRFTTLEEVLREYVLEVNVRQHNGKFHLPVFDEITRAPFSTPPLILLDGMPVFDFNKLMRYDPLKIRKLEVIGREYYLGGNSFDGIVNLTTYKGDMPGFEIDPRATIVDYEGLQLQRDFYSPVYETTAQYQSRLPDFRNLLYWSPGLVTNSDGRSSAGFYSSDIPGKYAIVIQGLSEDGRAGATISYFTVKK